MAGEAPAYLPVGTAVSAKYRGAFCEAKVKIINKKLVKCKVHFKDHTSGIVHDEFIKGNLKIGATVEAKHPEHQSWSEGVIAKLNDASVYTVLFDDGDEKTLRRSSLCLQGDRHFHESETLDHLPLTDPENFGTPVVRDRTKRKRSLTPRPFAASRIEEEEEEGESSGSEIFKRLRREEPESAIGRVVIVEMNEKRKVLTFPSLIVDPSCTKEAPNRTKDHIVTRSFRDNKYYTVSEPSWRSFTSKDHVYKGDVPAEKIAVEKAVLYLETGQLPPTWDYSILRNKDKIEGDSEGTVGSSDESSDDEYDMQKDAWLASLHKFMEERATPINKPPVLGYRDLNLYKLFKLAQDLGGWRKVTDKQQWRYIASKMGIPIHTSQSYNIKAAYNKYLFAFEDHNRKLGSSFNSGSVLTRPRRRSSYDRWTPLSTPTSTPKEDKRETTASPSAEKEKKKETPEEEIAAEVKTEAQSPAETKPATKKKTRRKPDSVEAEPAKEEESNKASTSEQKQTPPRAGGKRGGSGVAAKTAIKPDAEGEEDEEDKPPEFEVGEKVKVQYGKGKTHKVYEAKIVDVQDTEKGATYSVHYQGWNIRYDEVVTAERILSSAEKHKEKRLARQKAQRDQRQQEIEQQKARRDQRQRDLEQQKAQERLEQERQQLEAAKAKKERDKKELDERRERDRQEKERLKTEREESEKRVKEEEERQIREGEERAKMEKAREIAEQSLKAAEKAEETTQRQMEKKNTKAERKSTGKEKKSSDDKGGSDSKIKTPSKRGRPPSISPKTVGRPASPRVPGVTGKRSPSTSLYATRSLRSDRGSLTESPFASGLEAVKPKGRKGSVTGKNKMEGEEESGEDSEAENEVSKDSQELDIDEDPKPLEPVPEELRTTKEDPKMPVFEGMAHDQDETSQPPHSPPKLKKEVILEDVESAETLEEAVAVPPAEPEAGSKKSKRKGKKTAVNKDGKQEGGKKTSKRKHSKEIKGGKTTDEVPPVVKEEPLAKEEKTDESIIPEKMVTAEEAESSKKREDVSKNEETPVPEEVKKKKGRKRGRKSLEEKSAVGEKKAKKSSVDDGAVGEKRSRRRKKKHGEDNKEEEPTDGAGPSQEDPPPNNGEEEKEEKTVEAKVKVESRSFEEEKPEVVNDPDEDDTGTATTDRIVATNISTPPTTPESSATGISSINEDDEPEDTQAQEDQMKPESKSDSDSLLDTASSGSTASSTAAKNERLEEVHSNYDETEKETPLLPRRGRPIGSTKRRKQSFSEAVKTIEQMDKKSHRKKGTRRRTSSVSSSVKRRQSSSDSDDSSNAESKAASKVKPKKATTVTKENRIPKPCKYNFAIDVSHMSNPDDRIATIQKQLIDLREIYLQLKSEVASIDRRRKRFKRKEREAQAAALSAATSLANFSNSAPAASVAPCS